MISLVYFLLVGLAAGFLASLLGFGGGGLPKLLVVGVIGSFIGGYVVRLAGFKKSGVVAEVITATIGAVVLIFLLRQLG